MFKNKLCFTEKVIIFCIICCLLKGLIDRLPSEVSNNRAKQTVAETQKVLDLGITFQDFRENYQAQIEETGFTRLALQNLYWQDKQEISTFFCDLGYTAVIFGDVDSETGNILSITVGCEPEKFINEKKALGRCTLIYLLAARSLNPSFSREEIGDIVNKLSSNLKSYSVVKNNVRYRSKIYDKKLFLTIKHKDA